MVSVLIHGVAGSYVSYVCYTRSETIRITIGLFNLKVAIAMGNAGAKVKEVADFVVSTNDEDGVEEAIKKFVLNP